MAVAPTGAIFKALEFDGESSSSYGVYITGEAVYNAPEREVEMISIPGRNGAFALDKGRFENISVTYPAGIFADNERDFAEAISDFRNFLCSKKGYVRLTDDYNPAEYRMAIYKSGLEVSPVQSKAGEFEITFDCKPQRFLMSGDQAMPVSSGDTIFNPTLHDASPMLEAAGYGDITVNGYEIELNDDAVGHLTLLGLGFASEQTYFDGRLIDNGDTITQNTGISLTFRIKMHDPDAVINSITTSRTQSEIPITPTINIAAPNARERLITVYYGGSLTFAKDSPAATQTDKINCAITFQSQLAVLTTNIVADIEWTTNGIDCYIENKVIATDEFADIDLYTLWRGELTCESSQSVLGTPTYIDCDIGEAYKIVDDEPVSLNGYIDLGSKLPVLTSGNNEITFDNTITDLKIAPRWWEV